MSVRVSAGKRRGGGWKVVGPGLAGGRSPWHSVTQQGELPGGPTASFHSKGSHLFDQTYNFCASCSKQSGISTWKSVTWMHENCWLPSAFLSSIPTHHRPTRGLIRPSPQEMMGARRRCWLGQKTGILPNGDTPPRTAHSEVFLVLGFVRGRTCSLAGDPDTRTSEPGGKGRRELAKVCRPYTPWLSGVACVQEVGPQRRLRAKGLMLSSLGAGKDSGKPWTARRSNQSILREILREISPEYSWEELMLKLKLQYFGHLMWRAKYYKLQRNVTPWEKTKYRAYLREEEKFWAPVWLGQSQSQKSGFLHCCFHLQFHQQSCSR